MRDTDLPSVGDHAWEDVSTPSTYEMFSAFAAVGLRVTVEEQMLALTASVDGGILMGIFIGTPLAEFAKLLGDDAHTGLRRLIQRFDHSGVVQHAVFVRDHGVDALIEPELPPEAFLKLQGPLPQAPSGRIVYNRTKRQWQDASDS